MLVTTAVALLGFASCILRRHPGQCDDPDHGRQDLAAADGATVMALHGVVRRVCSRSAWHSGAPGDYSCKEFFEDHLWDRPR